MFVTCSEAHGSSAKKPNTICVPAKRINHHLSQPISYHLSLSLSKNQTMACRFKSSLRCPYDAPRFSSTCRPQNPSVPLLLNLAPSSSIFKPSKVHFLYLYIYVFNKDKKEKKNRSLSMDKRFEPEP